MRLTDFTLLLLEDDSDRLSGMLRAIREAHLDGRLRVLRDREEALKHFSQLLHAPESSHSVAFPSLFLLDLEGDAGLSVLEWLNRQPRLRRMVKVGLYPSSDGVVTNRAYQLGVNSCLARPENADGLLDMFVSIRQYWVALNHPPQL